MAGDENSAPNEQERAESKQPSTKPSIVGIGASAGGVQALQTFFEALPDRTGVAFVVIVHLAPESPSELPRILAARTCMLVTQVNEPAPLEPDHVYVIPPDRHLRISDNKISAHKFDSPRGQRAAPRGRGSVTTKRGTIPVACRGTTEPDLSVSAGYHTHLR